MPAGIRAAVPDPDSSTGAQDGSFIDHAENLFRPLIESVKNLFSAYQPYEPASTGWTNYSPIEPAGDAVTLLSVAAGAITIAIVGILWIRRTRSPAVPQATTVSHVDNITRMADSPM